MCVYVWMKVVYASATGSCETNAGSMGVWDSVGAVLHGCVLRARKFQVHNGGVNDVRAPRTWHFGNNGICMYFVHFLAFSFLSVLVQILIGGRSGSARHTHGDTGRIRWANKILTRGRRGHEMKLSAHVRYRTGLAEPLSQTRRSGEKVASREPRLHRSS